MITRRFRFRLLNIFISALPWIHIRFVTLSNRSMLRLDSYGITAADTRTRINELEQG